MATLQFPSNRNDYLGTLRFTIEGEGDTQGSKVEGGGGQIELYLPMSMQMGDKVEYENVGVGPLGANFIDASNAAMDVGGEASLDTFVGIAKGIFKSPPTDILMTKVKKGVSAFSERAGAAAGAAVRSAPNPNTRALFKQVNLRSFQFTFKMIPNNIAEAREIGKIITTFRKNMYPQNRNNGNAAYIFPNRFVIEALYDGFVMMDYNIATEPCFLESVMTNYNPSSQAFMTQGNSPQGFFSEIDLSLTFIEGKTLDRSSVEKGF